MTNKELNFISAVIYVHNAEKRLEGFLKMVIDVLEENFEKSEIIVVNDCSGDDSVSVIRNMSSKASYTIVSILNMSYFHGLETAMNAGVDLAIGDFVIEFDSTVQDFDKMDIMNIYWKALEGYDIVSASPNRRQRLTSRLFYYAFSKFANFAYEFQSWSFSILSRRAINRIDSYNKSIPYRKAVYANSGLKIANIRYEAAYPGRRCKEDKAENKYRKGLAIDSLILFTELGFRFSMMMTAIMMLVTVFMVIYALIIYTMSKPVAGWTTTILFVAFAFFGLFGVLTIIIKYLQILVNLVFRRSKYSFESIEKLTK